LHDCISPSAAGSQIEKASKQKLLYTALGGIGITVFLTADAAERKRPDICFSNKNRFKGLCRD
jgi:hypothetical protein